MKNAYKLLAAVAVSAFLTVSASAFAGDGSTPSTTAPAPKAAHHRHHHHHHTAMMCKKDKKGHCMHHHMVSNPSRPHETWMGTNPSDYYRHD